MQLITLTPAALDFVQPSWMTDEQLLAAVLLYQRNPDGAADEQAFLARLDYCIGGFCGLKWCGMFIGIEPNGYTHS